MKTESLSELFPGAVQCRVVMAKEAPEGGQPMTVGSVAFRRLTGVFRLESGELASAGAVGSSSSGVALQLLTFPDAAAARDFSSSVPTTEALRMWVAAGDSGDGGTPLLIQLQGVLICVGESRLAISGGADRIQAVTGAALEYFWLDAEVRRLERITGERWIELEEDTPAAFELTEDLLLRREQLQKRFQQMISAKAVLARLAPMIECPALYPPTLASQAGERLREKSRLGDRLQFLREQTEVFETVYELCGQRVSDYVSSRRSHTLEWIIIVLLACETILLVVDILGVVTTTAAT